MMLRQMELYCITLFWSRDDNKPITGDLWSQGETVSKSYITGEYTTSKNEKAVWFLRPVGLNMNLAVRLIIFVGALGVDCYSFDLKHLRNTFEAVSLSQGNTISSAKRGKLFRHATKVRYKREPVKTSLWKNEKKSWLSVDYSGVRRFFMPL